jgi:hypothetical protein
LAAETADQRSRPTEIRSAAKIELGGVMSDIKRNDPIFEGLSPADRETVMTMVKKGATRREVMGWMMAMGATATAAGAVFGAADKAWAETPKMGGKLIMAGDQHGPNDTLDPQLAPPRSTISAAGCSTAR